MDTRPLQERARSIDSIRAKLRTVVFVSHLWRDRQTSKRWTVVVEKVEGARALGLRIAHPRDESHLMVKGVNPGLVMTWNEANAENAVRSDDLIRGVNGATNSKAMAEKMKSETRVELLMERFDPERGRLQESASAPVLPGSPSSSKRGPAIERELEQPPVRQGGAAVEMAVEEAPAILPPPRSEEARCEEPQASLSIGFDAELAALDPDAFRDELRARVSALSGERAASRLSISVGQDGRGRALADLKGPVSAVARIAVLDLLDVLEVQGLKPIGNPALAAASEQAKQLNLELAHARAESRALRAALRRADERERRLHSGLRAVSRPADREWRPELQASFRPCHDEQVARFARAVESQWRQKDASFLGELAGHLRAPAADGGADASAPPQPSALAELCQAARERHAHRSLNMDFQGHLLATFSWLVAGCDGSSLDRLLGLADLQLEDAAQRNVDALASASLAASECFEAICRPGRAGEEAPDVVRPWVKWLCFLAASARQLPEPIVLHRCLRNVPIETRDQLAKLIPGNCLFWPAPACASSDEVFSELRSRQPGDGTCPVLFRLSGVTSALPLLELRELAEDGDWLLSPFSLLRVERVIGGEPLRVDCRFEGCALGDRALRRAQGDFKESSRELSKALVDVEGEKALCRRRLGELEARAEEIAEAVTSLSSSPRSDGKER